MEKYFVIKDFYLFRNICLHNQIMTFNHIKHVNLYFSGKYIPSAFPFGVLHKYQGKKRIISYLHIGSTI